MLKRLSGLVMVGSLLLSTGCFRSVVTTAPYSPIGHTETRWVHTVIGGLIPLNSVDGTSLCGSGTVQTVTTQHGLLSLVATGITMGIYTPVKVTVTCAPPAGTKG